MYLFKDKVESLRWPGSPGYAAHQDTAAGWLEYARRFVSVAIFLHSSNRETGGFEIVTAKHRDGRFHNVKGEMDKVVFDSFGPMLVPLEAGDLLVLDGETPHRTASNTSGKCVLHLIATFNPVSHGDQRSRYYDSKIQSFGENAISSNRFVFRVFEFAKK